MKLFILVFLSVYLVCSQGFAGGTTQRLYFEVNGKLQMFRATSGAGNSTRLEIQPVEGYYQISMDDIETGKAPLRVVEASIEDLFDDSKRAEVIAAENALEQSLLRKISALNFSNGLATGENGESSLSPVRLWRQSEDGRAPLYESEIIYVNLEKALKEDKLSYLSTESIKNPEGTYREDCDSCGPNISEKRKKSQAVTAVVSSPELEEDPNQPVLPKKSKSFGYCNEDMRGELPTNPLFGTRDLMKEGKITQEKCIADVKKVACRNHDWRGKSLPERMDLLKQKSSDLFEQAGFKGSTGVCLAARESKALNLNIVTDSFCADPKKSGQVFSTAAGLYQVIDNTFSEFIYRKIFPSYIKQEGLEEKFKQLINEAPETKFVTAQGKKYFLDYFFNTSPDMTVISKLEGSPSATKYCDDKEACRVNRQRLRAMMKDNPELQSLVSIAILRWKTARLKRNKLKNFTGDKVSSADSYSYEDLEHALERYHGGKKADNENYAKKISQCVQCMEGVKGKTTSDPKERHRCIALTLNDIKNEAGKVIERPTLKADGSRLSYEGFLRWSKDICECS